ncbi:MAG: hypothetical protein ACI8PT_002579 [Gammaproteobacteria bacterium]
MRNTLTTRAIAPLANALKAAISTWLIASERPFSDCWERALAYGSCAFANTGTRGTYSLFTVNDSPVTSFRI